MKSIFCKLSLLFRTQFSIPGKTILILLLSLFISSFGYSQSGWYSVTDSVGRLYLSSVQFTSENTGYSCGSYGNTCTGVFLKTTNAGLNWQRTEYGTRTIDEVYFLNNLTGYYIGWTFLTGYYSGYIYKTTNSGNNWLKICNGGIEVFAPFALTFTSTNTGYMSAYNSNKVYKTTNGGYNWIALSVNQNFWGGYSLSFINDNTGYVSSTSGRIYKTTNGGTVFVSNISSEVPEKYSLGQNYPNPYNPISNFKYKISKSSNVRITVFDVTGKEVETLVDEKQSPGEYLVTFDGSMLNSGVYFYRLVADGYSETRKMLLIK